MPKSEPILVSWARVRSAWWDVFVVLGEIIRDFGRRNKIPADRDVLQWEIETRRSRDEEH